MNPDVLAHGAQRPVFVVVGSHVLHLARELSGPEKCLMYGLRGVVVRWCELVYLLCKPYNHNSYNLYNHNPNPHKTRSTCKAHKHKHKHNHLVGTPPASEDRAVGSALCVARALLLLLHEARVPVGGVGGAEHVARAAAEAVGRALEHLLAPVDGAVFRHPAAVRWRGPDEQVVGLEEENAAAVRLDALERVVLEHDIAHVGVQHEVVEHAAALEEAPVEVEAVHADRAVRLVERRKVVVDEGRAELLREPLRVRLRPPAEEHNAGAAARAPQRREEDTQLDLGDVVLRADDELPALLGGAAHGVCAVDVKAVDIRGSRAQRQQEERAQEERARERRSPGARAPHELRVVAWVKRPWYTVHEFYTRTLGFFFFPAVFFEIEKQRS